MNAFPAHLVHGATGSGKCHSAMKGIIRRRAFAHGNERVYKSYRALILFLFPFLCPESLPAPSHIPVAHSSTKTVQSLAAPESCDFQIASTSCMSVFSWESSHLSIGSLSYSSFMLQSRQSRRYLALSTKKCIRNSTMSPLNFRLSSLERPCHGNASEATVRVNVEVPADRVPP